MFWIMIVEASVCVLISLPFGKSIVQKTIHYLSHHIGGKNSYASTIMNVILSVVTILFLSNVHTCWRYHASDRMLTDGLRIRLLIAQRDMYIAGFCLFLFLLLRRVYALLEANLRVEHNLNAMKKQAEGASNGYTQLLDENEKLKQKWSKLETLLGNQEEEEEEEGENAEGERNGKEEETGTKKLPKKVNIVEHLLQENVSLEKKALEHEKKAESAKKQLETIKKQAENQQETLIELIEKNATFENARKEFQQAQETIQTLQKEKKELTHQLQDYDFMFAETRKKEL